MDHSNRRRWLISAAVVLLLHAGVAVAVLTWRWTMSSPPVLIDLAPSPSGSGQNEAQATPPAPAAEQPAPAPAAPQQTVPEQSKTESASAAAGEQAPPLPSASPQSMPSETASPAEQSGANQNVAKAEQGGGAAEAAPGGMAGGPVSPGAEASRSAPPAINPRVGSPVVTGPVASAPAPGGLMPGSPMPSSPMANMPLDTSITVQPPVHGNRGIGPFANRGIGPLASREAEPLDHRPMSEFRPATPFGVPNIPRNSALPNKTPFAPGSNPSMPGIGLNRIPGTGSGAHVQDRARAAMAKAMNRNETLKNAIGSAIPSTAANGTMRADTNSANGINSSGTAVASRGDASGLNGGGTRNAIGVTANFRPRIPRTNAGVNTIGTAAAHAMPTAPIINGHDFARPAVGPGTIGGPARRGGTVGLSGSDFHLRHP